MAGFLKNASKAIGLAGDYNEGKQRPTYKEKNTDDAIQCITAIAAIIAGGWTVVKLTRSLLTNNKN